MTEKKSRSKSLSINRQPKSSAKKEIRNLDYINPGLFDVSQDIVEYVPAELVERWVKSPRKKKDANTLLNESIVTGTVVSSDTSGLTKISTEKDLIEVLSIISHPKEIVYSLGRSIKGQGIGIWAADNTQMFYDSSIPVEEIISKMVEAQQRIKNECQLKIGMGIHTGTFYKIGNGMYGQQADFIENLAEEYVDGGEIHITESVVKPINNNHKINEIENPLKYPIKIFNLEIPIKSELKGIDTLEMYPIPYSKEFFIDIKKLRDSKKAIYGKLLSELREKYIKSKIVVLVEREVKKERNIEVSILDDLASYTLMNRVSMRLLNDFEGKKIKLVGNLGIYVFSDVEEAIIFTRKFHKEMLKYGIKCKSGLAYGEVILFELPNGKRDIAGSPVNIASKISQDIGEFNYLYLTDEVFDMSKKSHVDFSDFKLKVIDVSHVSINAWEEEIV